MNNLILNIPEICYCYILPKLDSESFLVFKLINHSAYDLTKNYLQDTVTINNNGLHCSQLKNKLLHGNFCLELDLQKEILFNDFLNCNVCTVATSNMRYMLLTFSFGFISKHDFIIKGYFINGSLHGNVSGHYGSNLFIVNYKNGSCCEYEQYNRKGKKIIQVLLKNDLCEEYKLRV